MTGEERVRLIELCEQAVKEQDPQQLLTLVREINNLLEAKQARLSTQGSAAKAVSTE